MMRLLFQNDKDGLSTIRWRHVAKLCIERDVVVDYSLTHNVCRY